MDNYKFSEKFISEQRAQAEKAQPRPWICEWNWNVDADRNPTHEAWTESPTVKGDSLAEVSPQVLADWAYMKSAVNNYPAALTEIEHLQIALNEVRDELKVSRWIPVSERLPEKESNDIGDEYIVFLGFPYNRVAAMNFSGGGWFSSDYVNWAKRVTHWRPLPEPPSE